MNRERRRRAGTRQNQRILALAASVLAAVAGGCMNPPKKANREATERWNQARASVKAKLASDQLASGDVAGAASELAEAKRLAPADQHLASLQARVYLAQGNIGAARAVLESAQLAGKSQAEVEYLLGVVQQGQAAGESSLTHYLKAAELDPESATYAVAAVQVMLQLGRTPDALQYLQSREAQLGWTSAYSAALAECYEQAGDWRPAALAWRRVLDSAGGEGTAQAGAASPGPGPADSSAANGHAGRPAAGDAAARWINIRERWATALYHAGQWAEAVPVLQSLLQASETDAPVLLRLMLADCLLQTNDAAGARAQLDLALVNDGRDPRALRRLAQTLARLGEYGAALAAAERALETAPEHEPTLELAAALALRTGQVDLARSFARRTGPDNPVARVILVDPASSR